MEIKASGGVAEDRIPGAIEIATSRFRAPDAWPQHWDRLPSAILKLVGKDNWALFVGQWPAAFMLIGVHDKMVKQHGSDSYSRAA
jgi:methionyl-tRNA synthetase